MSENKLPFEWLMVTTEFGFFLRLYFLFFLFWVLGVPRIPSMTFSMLFSEVVGFLIVIYKAAGYFADS